MIIIELIAIVWSARILLNIFAYAHLWWVKEYRFDRMIIHLRTAQGRMILFPRLRRPRIAPKTLAIIVGTLGLGSLIFLFAPVALLWKLLIMDLVSFPTTAVVVLLLKVPTALLHEYRISKAVERLRTHPHLFVIGITGSFGKTSTKEMLAALLSSQYTVLKTEKSKNSPIAIAETVQSQLTHDHTVFIVEMGAYKKGEIARMCRMVQPQVGIVTAINEQHQDLFGSIETTMKAKYELVSGLQGKKTVVMNADNAYVQTMGSWAVRDGKTVVWYSKERTAQLYATDIKQTGEMLSFIVHSEKHKKTVRVPLIGEHHVSNMLAAMAAAMHAGMTFTQVVEATSRIVPFEKTMQPVPGIGGATFINDTFNNNPDAALAALNVLSSLGDGKKYIVFQPMIELGAYANTAHERVGKRAAEVADAIYLTNWNFHDAFVRGVRSVNADVSVSVLSPRDIAQKLKDTLQMGDSVVFKGKEAEAPLKILSSKS